MAPEDNLEHLGRQTMGRPPSNDDKCRLTKRDENMLEQGNPLTDLLDQESHRMDSSRGSLIENQVAPDSALEGPITRSEVKRVTQSTMMQLVNKSDAPIVQRVK